MQGGSRAAAGGSAAAGASPATGGGAGPSQAGPSQAKTKEGARERLKAGGRVKAVPKRRKPPSKKKGKQKDARRVNSKTGKPHRFRPGTVALREIRVRNWVRSAAISHNGLAVGMLLTWVGNRV